MIEYQNKKVKLLLSGNLILEGIIKKWSEKEVVLDSFDGQSTSIILHPSDDIRVIKILHDTVNVGKTTPVVKSDLEEKFQEAYNQPSENNDLRIKTLAELKQELIKQEKQIISEKLKDHSLSEIKSIQYSLPSSLLKKKD